MQKLVLVTSDFCNLTSDFCFSRDLPALSLARQGRGSRFRQANFRDINQEQDRAGVGARSGNHLR
jgi:hypothetical protein